MARYRIPPTLTEAVYRQEWERLDELLAQGVDINGEHPRTRTDRWRATPLRLAVEQQDLPLIRKLVKAGANVNHPYTWSNPMKVAIRTGNLDTVKLLHELGVSLGSRKESEPDYLLEALGRGNSHPEILEWLMGQGLDPCKINPRHKGWTLINSCLSSNVHAEQNRKTIDLLLDAGVDPRIPSFIRGPDDHKQVHPIASAVGHGDPHIVRRFLQAGCDPNLIRNDYIRHADGGDCPLIVTALLANNLENGLDVLEVLIEGGARTDIRINFNPHSIGAAPTSPDRDETGMPNERMDNMPLVALAACWSNARIVSCLLAHGQDIKACDRKGRNLLHGFLDHYRRNVSHRNDTLDIFNLLLEYGADPNHGDENGNTPFHFIFMHNLAKLRSGQTSYSDTAKLAETMIAYGADPLQENHEGKNCVELSGDHAILAELLLSISQQQKLRKNTMSREVRPRHRF